MKTLNYSYDTAHNFVKKRRPYIKPNDGFVKQLKEMQMRVEKDRR